MIPFRTPPKPIVNPKVMGRQRPLSFHGFDRLGRDKDKEKEREKEKEKGKDKDSGDIPVTPPSASSEQTKGTTLQITPPQQDDRKSSKSKNSSFVDLSQTLSMFGRFAPSPGSSNSTEGSPTDKRSKPKKEKEIGLERKSSTREKLKRMFGKKSGSDGGSILQSTISAEDLSHDEFVLPSNTPLDSPGARDVDLRSRPSADSLTSSAEISKPRMQAREEKGLLSLRRSREELGHRRSHSGLSYMVDVDSSDEGDKKDSALADMKSPKRKPRVMGPMESMIPVPKGRMGQTGVAGLGTILSASPSANITPVTGTPKSQSPAPMTSPTKNPYSRPAVRSPTSNKAKAMKYGSLNDEANATIRPRLKTRKPSAPLARIGIDDADGSVRARSNSLPALASSEESSDSGSSGSDDAKQSIRHRKKNEKNKTKGSSSSESDSSESSSSESGKSVILRDTSAGVAGDTSLPRLSLFTEEFLSQQGEVAASVEDSAEEQDRGLQIDETPDTLPPKEAIQHPEMTSPEDILFPGSLASPETISGIPSLNTQLPQSPPPLEGISPPASPIVAQVNYDSPTLNRKPSLVKQEINKWEQKLQESLTPSQASGKRGSFESTRSNTSSGWTTDEDQLGGSTQQKGMSRRVTSSLDAIGASEEELRLERVAKEVHLLIDETEQEVRKHRIGREEVVEHADMEMSKDHQGNGLQEELTPTAPVPASPRSVHTPMSSPPSTNGRLDFPSASASEGDGLASQKSEFREVPVESLDNVIKEVEIGSLDNHLSPRLIPLPSGSEQELVVSDEVQYDEDDDLEGSVIFEPTKVAGSILLDSPTNSSVYEHPISRRKSQSVDVDVVSEPEDIVSEPEDVVSEHEDVVSASESEDTETEEDDEGDVSPADRKKKGVGINMHQIILCSTATQTDLLLPMLPPVLGAGSEASQATDMGSAEHVNLGHTSYNWDFILSDGQKTEMMWSWILENWDKLTQEQQRKYSVRLRRLSSNSATRRNSISGVGTDGEQETVGVQSSETTSTTISRLGRGDSAGTRSGSADASPASTTESSTKEVVTVNHQISYAGAGNWAFWLKMLVLFVSALAVSLWIYVTMGQHHLFECGYAPEYQCACLPETVYGVNLFGEEQCLCVFWPRIC